MGSALSDRGFRGGDAPLATVPRGSSPRMRAALEINQCYAQQLYEYGLESGAGDRRCSWRSLGPSMGSLCAGDEHG